MNIMVLAISLWYNSKTYTFNGDRVLASIRKPFCFYLFSAKPKYAKSMLFVF